MKRERCPRKPDYSEREKRIIDIEKKLTTKYKNIFRTLLAYYDKKLWEKFENRL
jgi:hypothetical protein